MARLMLLESFDLGADPVASGPTEEWQAGHRCGFAEGLAAAAADQTALRATTAQALADLTLSARAAQNLILDRLAPLFAAITDRIVPVVLHETLGQHIRAICDEAARQDCRADILLCVAPDDLAAITATLAGIAGGGISLRPDPRVAPGQILLDHGAQETALDTGGLARDIAAALAALAHPDTRRFQNG